MRRLLAISLVVFLNSGLAEDMPNTVEAIVARDIWAVAEGSDDGKPLIIRFRSDFSKRPDVRKYPKLVEVSWSFKNDASGLPDPPTSAAMSTFEDRLVSAVESDLTAVLTAVITHNGYRTWVYYASNTSAFVQRLQGMPQEEKPYPIQIEIKDDPAWAFLHDNILAGMEPGEP